MTLGALRRPPPPFAARLLAASFLLTLLAALGLRLHRLERAALTMDSLDTLASARHLARGEFIVLRNDGAYDEAAYAPVAEWLYAPAALLRDSPRFAAAVTAAANVAAIALVARIGARHLSPEAGLAAALLLALSKSAIFYGRQPINTHLMTPFVVLYLALLLRRRRGGRFARHFAPALAFSVAAQLNASCWALLLLHPLAFAARRPAPPSRAALAGCLAGWGLPLLPLLVSEWRLGFRGLASLLANATRPRMTDAFPPFRPGVAAESLVAQVSEGRAIPWLLAAGLTLLLLPGRRSRLRPLPRRLILSWLALHVAYLTFVAWRLDGRFFPHYLAAALPAAALAAGAGFSLLPLACARLLRRVGAAPDLARGAATLAALALLAPWAWRTAGDAANFIATSPAGVNSLRGLQALADFATAEIGRRATAPVARLTTLSDARYGYLTPGGLLYLTPFRTAPYHNDHLRIPRGIPWLETLEAHATGSAETYLVGFLPRAEAHRLRGFRDAARHTPPEPLDDARYIFFLAALDREPPEAAAALLEWARGTRGVSLHPPLPFVIERAAP